VWASQGRKMARLEQESLVRYDAVVAVSNRDRTALAKRYNLPVVEAIDTGVDLDFFAMNPPDSEPDPGTDRGTLVFTATMSWTANVEGIHFLLDEVWPRLTAARPNLRAVIIGRNPPPALSEKIRARGLNVTLTGFVDDIRPYVAAANVYVIPLFVGSGTRIKAFEAMAMGRPVVSTTLGIEGLDVTDGEHFLRADDAEAFASAILTLLADAATRADIARAARILMQERFSWSKVAAQFEAICLRTLECRRGQRPGRDVAAS
jgi:polysaccharide biosynthesis protein PslH